MLRNEYLTFAERNWQKNQVVNDCKKKSIVSNHYIFFGLEAK